jgi:hypothetical protein
VGGERVLGTERERGEEKRKGGKGRGEERKGRTPGTDSDTGKRGRGREASRVVEAPTEFQWAVSGSSVLESS